MQTIPSHDERPAPAASDAELLHRSLDDVAQFDVVMSRHLDAIFGFVAMRVGPQLAEDIVAETFATAFRLRARFDGRALGARPWLYGIASNRLHKFRESERRWLRGVIEEPVGAPPDEVGAAESRVDARRLAPDLAQALSLLSPGERDVLLLHALCDLGHVEIARALGIRHGTAKTRLSRATARLRPLLDHAQTKGGGRDDD
jgi:RNA polymerase sigma factor (sigma-70 family)